MKIHPEIYKAVDKEYRRLASRYPELSHSWKLDKALQFVRAVAMADTALLKHMIMEEV